MLVKLGLISSINSAPVVAAVKRPLGQICLWGIFIWGVSITEIFNVIWLAPALFLIGLFPQLRTKWIPLLSIISWAASSSVFMVTDRKTYYVDFFKDYANKIHLDATLSVQTFKFLALAVVLVAFWILFVFFPRLNRLLGGKEGVFILLVFYVSSVASYVVWPVTGVWGFFLSGLIVISSKFILYFTHHIRVQGEFHPGKLFPLWAQYSIPLVGPECTRGEDFARCQLRGLKLLLWCLVLLGASLVLQSWARKHHISVLVERGFDGLPAERSVFLSWILLLYSYLKILLTFTIYHGVYVSVARMCGYSLPRDIYRPFEAKDFNQYFRRTNYYYCEVLSYLFFYPIWNASRRLHLSKQLRLFGVTFSTVFFGGIVIKTIMNVHLVIAGGVYGSWRQVLLFIPYFALIGLFSAVSAVLRKKLFRKDTIVVKLVRPCVFVAAFSIAIVFLVDARNPDWSIRWAFLRSLFGLH